MPAGLAAMKQAFFALLLLLFSCLVSLLLLEHGLRRFYFTQWEEQNLVGNPDHRMTLRYHSNINSDGIRSSFEAVDFRAADFNVVFLGDSFVYGWRVKMGQTIPAQFEKQALAAGFDSVRSVNFGWVTSSPFLSHRLLQDIGHKYQPDLVVLLLDMTDIFDDRLYRNIVERRYAFRWGQYLPAITQFASQLNQSVWKSEWFAQQFFGVPGRRYFIVEQPLAQTRLYFDETMANIDAIHAYSRDILGAPFVLYVLPRYFQFDPGQAPDNWERNSYPLAGPYLLEPFHYFHEASAGKPYPVVSLLEPFQQVQGQAVTFPDDPHLNEQGNALVASWVLAHLQGLGLLP